VIKFPKHSIWGTYSSYSSEYILVTQSGGGSGNLLYNNLSVVGNIVLVYLEIIGDVNFIVHTYVYICHNKK
jgi:hypothetical protein